MYVSGCDVSLQSEMLSRLGKHKTGKGCLYVNKLADINKEVLKEMIKDGYDNPSLGVM